MAGEIVLEAFRRILAALRGLGLDPVLVGGLGIQAWGRVRQTKDVDLLILAGEPDRERLFRAAEARQLARDLTRPVTTLSGITILRLLYVDPKYGVTVHIDLIEAASEFLRETVRRAPRILLFQEEIRVASCEDLILMKLVAARAIDRADAADLIRLNASTLDRAYLDAMAQRLGLQDELRGCEDDSRREG